MTTIEILEAGIKTTIPSSWDELSPEQTRHIIQLYDKAVRFGWSPLAFNVRVLFYLLNVKRNWRSVLWERMAHTSAVEARNVNIYMLCEQHLGWLFRESEENGLMLNYTSIVNALPSVKTGLFRRRLYGPSDALLNLSFGEFRQAATALNSFFSTRNPEHLDECIAHLYRVRSIKRNRAGRKVESVDNANANKAILRASKMQTWQKTLIMLWFSNCINYLQTGIVNLEGEEVDMSRMFSGGGKSNSDVTASWHDLLIEVAREGTIGNIERVDEEPLYSIIGIMWHNYKENKRNEKASKTN